ncbi:protein AF-17-like isoform X3 [Colius striatus]|uniref:protein AF-17-like isoform X3 n=1 Tax=Colius striatus TaxID=57412 RepID=UPI002B1DD453|nr:protein AF-17-like isoform X3 [Colius striatus]
MKEMVGGCCVCSDERGWAENPLVYCDGHGCNVAVHQACYGIVQVPTGPWFCRKCESQERAARVRCELCPHKDGALKRTDNGGWAHVVCALYIPEVQFANVLTMEPIVLQYIPHDRFNKTCYICEEQGRESKAACGACMACNRHGCRQAFHVTCAQMAGLLCEEEVLEVDNVKYCGYCKYHFNKMKTSRHSGGSSFIAGRRSRSTSPAQEKHVSHHERPKKSRKDKERPKQKHKKRPELPRSLTPSLVPVAAEKGSTSHHEGSKETSEVSRSEVKGRKSSSHGSSHKGKKTGSGKSSVGFSSASSSGTFQPAGIYTSNKDPISHGGGVLRTVCSTPLSSSLLAHQGTSSLPQLNRSPFASTIPASSSSVSTTQVFSLADSTFSHPSSRIFGSTLASGLSINPLLNQSESSRAELDLEDCSFDCRGTSPQESLSSMSPISSLPTLFDQTVSCSSSGQLENVPQATPNIEQLLEKQGNGEAGVNIVEMLKALHSLQKENQRLQEQIMTLTAKKERLQLLNVQLSVPFPVVTSSNGPGSQAQYILPPNVCNDSLSISKSPPCKNSFGIENSLSTSSEDPHSGCPSRSSSSLSFHSTPPPLPMLQQSPASLPLPGVQQVNGLARVAGSGLGGGSTASHSPSTVPMVDGLMGTLAGGQQMPINGILGSMNGAQAAQSPSTLTQASGLPTLQLSTSLSSVPSLSPLTEQQRHVLHQHEQQLQQLQQLLTSQPLNPEQQALVFQMMQQIQQKRELQRLQMMSSSQLSMTSLLAATSASLHSSASALMTSAPQPPPSSSSLLASLSPQQLNPSNALMAPQATPPLSAPGNSLLVSGTGISPILTAQTNPFLNLQADGNTPKGMLSYEALTHQLDPNSSLKRPKRWSDG